MVSIDSLSLSYKQMKMKYSEMGIKEQSFGAKFWKESRNLWTEGLRLRFWKSSKAPAMIQQSHSIRNFQRERKRKSDRELWAYYRAVGLNHRGGLPWICTKTVEFFLSLSLSLSLFTWKKTLRLFVFLGSLGNWNDLKWGF